MSNKTREKKMPETKVEMAFAKKKKQRVLELYGIPIDILGFNG